MPCTWQGAEELLRLCQPPDPQYAAGTGHWRQLTSSSLCPRGSARLFPAPGQLLPRDSTSWATLCSRCSAITSTDVSAITARAV